MPKMPKSEKLETLKKYRMTLDSNERSTFMSVVIIVVSLAILGFIAYIGLNIYYTDISPKQPYSVIDEKTGKESFYDEKGALTHSITREYYDKSKSAIKSELYRNSDNAMTKAIYYKTDGKSLDYIDKYSDNKIISRKYYENNEETGKYADFAYDSKGNEICCIVYDPTGKIESKTEKSYNSKDLVDVLRESDGEGNLILRTEYTYNSIGQKIKETYYDSEGTTGFTLFEYDKNGNVIKTERAK